MCGHQGNRSAPAYRNKRMTLRRDEVDKLKIVEGIQVLSYGVPIPAPEGDEWVAVLRSKLKAEFKPSEAQIAMDRKMGQVDRIGPERIKAVATFLEKMQAKVSGDVRFQTDARLVARMLEVWAETLMPIAESEAGGNR